MAIYAVGDVQGCFEALEALLARCAFDPARDRVWLTGDLVNRGPQSLEVLRFVRGLGNAAVTVLGNHDLHLLAVAHGAARLRDKDTLDTVLAAPDRDGLLEWLAARPLLHYDATQNSVLVHAGLWPTWDVAQARRLAGEVEAQLRAARAPLLAQLYGDAPRQWDEALIGPPRWRLIVNVMTRMRYLDSDGQLDFAPKGPPGTQPAGRVPWFALPRVTHATRTVFGHWSSLGLLHGPNLLGIDSGCVWGESLSAVRLDDGAVFRVRCSEHNGVRRISAHE